MVNRSMLVLRVLYLHRLMPSGIVHRNSINFAVVFIEFNKLNGLRIVFIDELEP